MPGKHHLWLVTALMTSKESTKSDLYEQVVATPTENFLSHLAEINAVLLASWSDRPHTIELRGFKTVWVADSSEIVVI